MLADVEIEKNILARLPERMREKKLIPLIFERISKWGDVNGIVDRGELDFFFQKPKYPKEKLIFQNSSPEKISENLKLAIRALEEITPDNFTAANIKTSLMLLADHLEKRGELLHPVRFALSGVEKSPDPFIIASILGKDETISRLQKAV